MNRVPFSSAFVSSLIPDAFIALLVLVVHVSRAANAQPPKEVGAFSDKPPENARVRLGTTKLRHSGELNDMVLSPDGTFMITLRGGVLYRWNMETGFMEGTHQHVRKGSLRGGRDDELLSSCKKQLVLSSDGKTLAYQAGEEINLISADLKGPQVFTKIENRVVGNSLFIKFRAFQFEDGNESLVTVDSQNLVNAHRADKQGFASAAPGLKGSHFGLTATHCAIATDDGFAVLYDWRTRTRLHQFAEDGIVSLAFAPDGRYLALSTYKSGILIWDAKENKEVTRYRYKGNYVSSMAITPDGQRLFVVVDGTVQLQSLPEQ